MYTQLIPTAELVPECRELVIEESCSCRIIISQSQLLHTADSDTCDKPPISSELCFDLDGGREQWIIAGQNKARFSMEVSGTVALCTAHILYCCHISLILTHH